jgi:hypothetical protein
MPKMPHLGACHLRLMAVILGVSRSAPCAPAHSSQPRCLRGASAWRCRGLPRPHSGCACGGPAPHPVPPACRHRVRSRWSFRAHQPPRGAHQTRPRYPTSRLVNEPFSAAPVAQPACRSMAQHGCEQPRARHRSPSSRAWYDRSSTTGPPEEVHARYRASCGAEIGAWAVPEDDLGAAAPSQVGMQHGEVA